MSLFETLKNKYPIQQIALYGDCIIIPTAEFEKDWEKRLKEEGYMSHIVQIDYHSKWAVQLRKAEIYTKTPFPEPKPQPTPPTNIKATKASKADWTQEDKDRLMKRWVEVTPTTAMGKARELLKEFPGRSEQSLYLMYYGLTGGKATHQRKTTPKQPKPAATKAEPSRYPTKDGEEPSRLTLSDEMVNYIAVKIERATQGLREEIYKIKEELSVLSVTKIGKIDERLENLEYLEEGTRAAFEDHKHALSGEAMLPFGTAERRKEPP